MRANEEKLREVINMTDNGDRCETAIKQMMLVAKEVCIVVVSFRDIVTHYV